MGVAFVILFPLGALTIRFWSKYFRHPATVHSYIQLTALAITIVGTGLGIWLTPNAGRSTESRIAFFVRILIADDLLGLVVVSALVLQALLGYYHHYRYVRDKPTERRWFTYLHIASGFLLVVTGIFNGPSGLTMARVPTKYVNLWWAFSGILPICYIIASTVKCCVATNREDRATQGATGDAAVESSQPEPNS